MTTLDHIAAAAATPRNHDNLDIADVAAMLRRVPLLSGLSGRQLRRIARLAQTKDYTRGDVVIAKGDGADAFLVILSGHAHVMTRRTLGLGDYFGELALVGDAPRSATVIAGNDLRTAEIPRRSFLRLLATEHEIALSLLRTLAARAREADRSTPAPVRTPAAADVGWPVPGLAG